MTEPATARPRARLDSGTTYMLVATVLAAVAAYAFQLVVGRVLGPDEFAPSPPCGPCSSWSSPSSSCPWSS